jgi:hypothetical protein
MINRLSKKDLSKNNVNSTSFAMVNDFGKEEKCKLYGASNFAIAFPVGL